MKNIILIVMIIGTCFSSSYSNQIMNLIEASKMDLYANNSVYTAADIIVTDSVPEYKILDDKEFYESLITKWSEPKKRDTRLR